MDTFIKTQEAAMWIEEVNTEIQCVEMVLKQTKECLEHDPDDDIWFEYERIVNKLDNYWNGLIKGSKKACEIISGVIKSAENVGKEIIEEIKASESRMKG